MRFGLDAYTVLVLVLSTNAFLTLIVGADDSPQATQGSPVMRVAWAIVYAITFARAVKQREMVGALLRANKPLVFLIVMTLASVLWSIDPGLTIHAAVILLFTTLFAIDLSIRYTLVRQMQLLCMALTLVVALSVFVELFLPGFVPGRASEETAWHGVFGAKNEFGRVVTLGVGAWLALPHRRRWSNPLVITIGVLLGVLARSAGAVGYLAMIVVFFLWLPVLKWKPKLRQVTIAASAIVVLLGASFVALNLNKVTAMIGRDPHFTGRTVLWEMSVADMQERPLLGYGYEAFWNKTSQPARIIREEANWEAPHSHNGYIDLTLGLGFIGLGLYAVIFWTITQRSYLFFMRGQEGYRKWPLIYLAFTGFYQLTESSIVAGDTIGWILYCCLAFSLPQIKEEWSYARPVPRQEFAR
jgi:exopolysaccharide production protein ExoQ